MRKTLINDLFVKSGRVDEDGRLVRDMYLREVKKLSQSTCPWNVYKLIKIIPGMRRFGLSRNPKARLLPAN